MFRQHTSRALDPQLHTHLVISNRVKSPDGRWLALDARTIKKDQRALSAIYHAGLRAEITKRLGVRWRQPENGIAEIADVPEALILEFSARTAEMRRRRTNQMSQEQMVKAADRVIQTDGTLIETERCVLRAWLELGLPLSGARVAGRRRNQLLIAVRMDAPEARALYERLGFTECGRLTEEIAGRYVDQIIVEFPL